MPDLHSKRGVPRALLCTGLVISLVLSVVYLVQPAFVDSTNDRTLDLVMNLAHTAPTSGTIVIVNIDEKSLARYGQWPWPRDLLARLLRAINEAGASGVGLDMVLAEPDRTSSRRFSSGVGGKPDHPVDTSGVTCGPSDHDRTLAGTLEQGPFVLGYEFFFGESPKLLTPCDLQPPSIVWGERPDTVRDRTSFFTAQSLVCNRQLFSDAVRHSGFMNAAPDADGVLRRIPMLIRFGGRLYPSLALATLMQYVNSSRIEISLNKTSGSIDLKVGNRSIPVDTQGSMIVQFSRRDGTIPSISAGDLLNGAFSPEKLRHKIVLVGTSAAGLEPTYQTSTRLISSHAEIHAEVLDNMLAGQLAVRTGNFLWWEVLIGLLVAAVTVLIIAKLKILPSLAVCLTMLAGTWLGMRLTFQECGYLLSPLLPTFLVVANFAVLTIIKTWKIQVVTREVADSTLTLLKSSEENLNSIIEAVPDIIFRLDPTGRIAFISPAIARYAGHADALIGQPMLHLVKIEYHDAFVKLTEKGLQGTPGNLEFEAVDLEGSHFWLDAHVVPLRNESGEIISLLGIARNITDRKYAEKALAEKHLQLEELNRHLEQRVTDAVSESREKDQIMIQQNRQAAMGEVIGNIAHQWRQPLNVLGLIVQELRMTYGRDEFNKKSLETSVDRAMGLISQMSKTIDDFNNYFKPDKEKTLFNVNKAVVRTISLIEQSLKNQDIKIDVVEMANTDVKGYVHEYSQVLLNIISNCQDAFEGCRIDRQRLINIAISKENGRSVVTITDNAGGIPEGVIGKIFDPYFTTKGPDKGTGIGLYMSKAIIEKGMGGKLAVRNTADGAEFRIEV